MDTDTKRINAETPRTRSGAEFKSIALRFAAFAASLRFVCNILSVSIRIALLSKN